jgi:Cu/Ag efflux protein CusF
VLRDASELEPINRRASIQTEERRPCFIFSPQESEVKIHKSSASAAVAAIIAVTASVTTLAIPHRAAAQSTTMQNVIPQSEEVTLQAKIKKIDATTRAVTLESPSGQKVTVTAGRLVRLNLLKVGDTVNAKYFRSVAFAVNGPSGGNGTPMSNDQMAAVAAQPVQAPGGVAVGMIKISGTILEIDLASNSLSIVNPSGGLVYTVDVTDPARQAMLSSLKVGDTVTAVVSQVLAISIEPAPKHWW